ncbi:hypothetical protein niasHS_008826 [Heterodera schachtii]|uniref:Uncharacterized protein n=1 Tax=Heterodera schachtii TaxID=97005 RepID=A0ABD2IVK2_HETSC
MSEWTLVTLIAALLAIICYSNFCAAVSKQWEFLDLDDLQGMRKDNQHGKWRYKRDGTSVKEYNAKNINYTKFYARVVANKCLLTVNKTQEEVERAEEEEKENVANGNVGILSL